MCTPILLLATLPCSGAMEPGSGPRRPSRGTYASATFAAATTVAAARGRRKARKQANGEKSSGGEPRSEIDDASESADESGTEKSDHRGRQKKAEGAPAPYDQAGTFVHPTTMPGGKVEHQCSECALVCKSKSGLRRHVCRLDVPTTFLCEHCGNSFGSPAARNLHISKVRCKVLREQNASSMAQDELGDDGGCEMGDSGKVPGAVSEHGESDSSQSASVASAKATASGKPRKRKIRAQKRGKSEQAKPTKAAKSRSSDLGDTSADTPGAEETFLPPLAPANEKPFPCSLCGKRFKTRGGHSKHSCISDNPLRCPKCLVVFTRDDSMVRHVMWGRCKRSVGNYSEIPGESAGGDVGVSDSDDSTARGAEHLPTPEAPSSWNCTHCGETFNSKGARSEHERRSCAVLKEQRAAASFDAEDGECSEVSDEDPHPKQCPECKTEFSSKGARNKHVGRGCTRFVSTEECPADEDDDLSESDSDCSDADEAEADSEGIWEGRAAYPPINNVTVGNALKLCEALLTAAENGETEPKVPPFTCCYFDSL